MFTVCQGRCLCSSKGGKAIFCYGEVGNQVFKADDEQDFFLVKILHGVFSSKEVDNHYLSDLL